MIIPAIFAGVTPLYVFPIILAVSLVGCIAGSLLTEPDDEEVLKNFYLRVRPWGFWRPIHEKVAREHPGLRENRSFSRDMFNVAIGIVWQTSLTATGILLVLQDFAALAVCAGLVVVTSAILKVNWYDRMEDYPDDLRPDDLERMPRAAAPVTGAAPSR
jgi:solute:Na+ symporter, SSS family